MRIGIDIMGSDTHPSVLVEAALTVSRSLDCSAKIVAIGERELVDALEESNVDPGIEFIASGESITMDDPPLLAVRRKAESSMLVGLRLLREGKLDGLISAGNTGALIAGSKLILPLLPGVERPALLATLPTVTGNVVVIDIGGNVICKPAHLLQYIEMGVAYQQCAEGLKKPRAGLLNIGTEARKGTKAIREAYDRLTAMDPKDRAHYEFVGNVEGREAFQGGVDVLVSEGFTGNVFLKTAEGISSFILNYLEEAFADSMVPSVRSILDNLSKRVNYAEYPGAIVCGVEGVVVKCHGYSCQQAVANGIKGAVRLVQTGLIARMKKALTQ